MDVDGDEARRGAAMFRVSGWDGWWRSGCLETHRMVQLSCGLRGVEWESVRRRDGNSSVRGFIVQVLVAGAD